MNAVRDPSTGRFRYYSEFSLVDEVLRRGNGWSFGPDLLWVRMGFR